MLPMFSIICSHCSVVNSIFRVKKILFRMITDTYFFGILPGSELPLCFISSPVAESFASARSRLGRKAFVPKGRRLFALLRRLRRIKKSPFLPARPPALHCKLFVLSPSPCSEACTFVCLPRLSASLLAPL